MKRLLTKLRYVPKHFGIVAAMLLATVGTAVTFAWGPGRDTFTVENPAPHVTFNSITNNPIDGDERNFSRAKDTTATAPSAWTDNVQVTPGKEYIVRMVVHNNAADNLNLNAINTRASASVPTTTGKSVTVSNFVSADNAKPAKVWDDVTFTGSQDFNLAFVPGSARIYNNGYAAGGNGQPLPDSIVTSAGAVLGYNKAGDGIIPGCFQYLSYVEYKVKPQFAPTSGFEVAKTVRKSGTTTWNETVAVNAGDIVQYRIKYTNTSGAEQKDVVVKDQLPTGVSYVNGTTKLYNNLFPNGKEMSDNITGAGINIGAHSGGATSFVVFDAKVANNSDLTECGTNTLKNIAKVTSGSETKSDDAVVTVTKKCEEVPAKIKVCDLKTWNIREINEKDFDASKHSRTLDDCKEKVCDYTTKTIVTINKNEFKDAVHTRDMSKCEAEQAPQVLPSTGPGAILGGLFGSSALGLGISSYIRSRNALSSALNR